MRRAQGNKRSTQEVEAMIREKTQAMERESLTMKEEKAALAEMKRMKDDNKKMMEWEAELDNNRNKRTHFTDLLRQLYEEMATRRTNEPAASERAHARAHVRAHARAHALSRGRRESSLGAAPRGGGARAQSGSA